MTMTVFIKENKGFTYSFRGLLHFYPGGKQGSILEDSPGEVTESSISRSIDNRKRIILGLA